MSSSSVLIVALLSIILGTIAGVVVFNITTWSHRLTVITRSTSFFLTVVMGGGILIMALGAYIQNPSVWLFAEGWMCTLFWISFTLDVILPMVEKFSLWWKSQQEQPDS